MALMTATTPAAGGTVITGAAVAASDTIAAADLGSNGAYLLVTNGSGGSINVTVSDGGSTVAGNVGTTSAVAVANGATKAFYIHPKTVNLSTLVTTVTYSGTSSVTYVLYRLG